MNLSRNMQRLSRIKTFRYWWPAKNSASMLANAGLYYDADLETVTCQRCGVSLGCSPDADYMAMHRISSPNCVGDDDDDDDDSLNEALQSLRRREETVNGLPSVQAGTLEPDNGTLESDCVGNPQHEQRGAAWNPQGSERGWSFDRVVESILQRNRNAEGGRLGRPQDRDALQQRETYTVNGRGRGGLGQGATGNELMEEHSLGANGSSGVAESVRLGVSEDEPSSSAEEEPRLDLDFDTDQHLGPYSTGWSDDERSGEMREEGVLRREGAHNPPEDLNPNRAIPSIPDQPNAAGAAAPAASVSTLICTICFERDKDCALLDCGHMICTPCGANLQELQKPCPWCRQKIVKLQRLFV